MLMIRAAIEEEDDLVRLDLDIGDHQPVAGL